MWWFSLLLFLLTYLMGDLHLSYIKIWKFTTQSSCQSNRQRQRISHLSLNNKHTIRYDPSVLREIGKASQHDKHYRILPFGCIQVIRNLRLNVKPISKCQRERQAGQGGVNRVYLIMAKRFHQHDPQHYHHYCEFPID